MISQRIACFTRTVLDSAHQLSYVSKASSLRKAFTNKFIRNLRQDVDVIKYQAVRNYTGARFHRPECRTNTTNLSRCGRFLLYAGVAEVIALSPSDSTDEEERKKLKADMIVDIKRGILFLREGDFRKAEDVLHVALGKARELQDPQGEVYILDLLANLYYEERKYEKAEATFKEVLRRELAAGKPEDTEAIVEISAKLARMYAETRQFDKARAGFDFCLEKLEKKLETLSEDKKEEVVDLFFKVLQWASDFMLSVEDKADDALVEATELIENGLEKARHLEQTGSAAYQTLANNLSTLYTWQNRMDEAVAVMKETIKLAVVSEHWSLSHFYLNLAHIYAENGDFKNAQLSSEKAMEVAVKAKDLKIQAEVKRLQESLKDRIDQKNEEKKNKPKTIS